MHLSNGLEVQEELIRLYATDSKEQFTSADISEQLQVKD